MKWIFFLIQFIGIFMIILLMDKSSVQAEMNSSYETKGSIGFYGIYESEMEPKPVPPSGQNPIYPSEVNDTPSDSKFPKTGQLLNRQWFWLGIIVLLVALYLRKMNYRGLNRIKLSHN